MEIIEVVVEMGGKPCPAMHDPNSRVGTTGLNYLQT